MISLPGFFQDQGFGYTTSVSYVTLIWTDPVKMSPKGRLESNLITLPSQLVAIPVGCDVTRPIQPCRQQPEPALFTGSLPAPAVRQAGSTVVDCSVVALAGTLVHCTVQHCGGRYRLYSTAPDTGEPACGCPALSAHIRKPGSRLHLSYTSHPIVIQEEVE